MSINPSIDLGDIVASVLALTAILISYIVYRSESDPDVVVYAALDENQPSLIYLVIENIGGGVAHDVEFLGERDIPADAFGIAGPDRPARTMSMGAFAHGIPVLHPGERRKILWGQYGGLLAALDRRPLEITSTFHRRRFPFRFVRRLARMTRASVIDVRSFEHDDAADNNWGRKIAQELKKLREVVQVAAKNEKRGAQKGSDEVHPAVPKGE